MPAKKSSGSWAIQPHTEAKLAILAAYLKAWFPILSLGGFERVIYIDGFAGPGGYLGGQEGSPVLALRALAAQRLALRSAFEFHFVERTPNVAEALKTNLAALREQGGLPPNTEIHVHERATFVDAFDGVIRDRLVKYSNAPAFALVDPFGWTGIPMRVISDLVRRPSTEVLVNFMFEEINRFLAHPDQPANFDELFGGSGWRPALKLTGEPRKQFLHDLYRDQLQVSARYVRSFEMRNERGVVDYFLFFATNNLRGLEKMKEAMWRVDPAGGFTFSDATDPNQITLFASEPNRAQLRQMLVQHFAGRRVRMSEVHRFVVEATPFLGSHYKKVLKALEAEERIRAVNPMPSRKPGTYPDPTMVIEFASAGS